MITVKILPNTNEPATKLADAELHFTEDHDALDRAFGLLAGIASENTPYRRDLEAAIKLLARVAPEPLAGLKLVGFAVWQRANGARNVTFPARSYAINGERRSFALLRPATNALADANVRQLVLDAYAEHEALIAIRDEARR